MKSLQKTNINPGNAVLFIVDVQNEFLKPGGCFYTDASALIGPGVIAAIKGLKGRARSAGVPAIYIQSVRTGNEPEVAVFSRPRHLIINSWGSEIVDELKPEPGDSVVQKYSHDAFYRTRLDETLRNMVPDPTRCQAIVTGGSIGVCVYHALLGLYLRDYWTFAVTDAIYYGMPGAKEHALEMLSWRAYPNIFLTRTDLISVSPTPTRDRPKLVPGT